MANQHSALRFDHREIAVIFSLFIFTSLLMFTVGIMVGKGISQAKYENGMGSAGDLGHSGLRLPSSETPHSAVDSTLGTSISTDHPKKTDASAVKEHGATPAAPPAAGHAESHGEPHAKAAEEHGASKKSALADVTDKVTESGSHDHGIAAAAVAEKTKHVSPSAKPKIEDEHDGAHSEKTETADLELIPEKPKTGDVRGSLSDFANKEEVAAILQKPKVKELLENEPSKGRALTSLASPKPTANSAGRVPASFSEGRYTVQIGSYPTKADATTRVNSLKQLGFTHAYLSSKELGDKKDTWYRVWLGYFPDAESAKASGELLQARNEVKSYLVRKTDTKED